MRQPVHARPAVRAEMRAGPEPQADVTGRLVRNVRPSPAQIVAWLGVVCLLVSVSVARYDSYQFGAHYDDARYVILAKSLIFSDRYGMINAPGGPSSQPFPFAFPLALSMLMRVFADNIEPLKLISLFATVVNCAILLWGWRRLTGNSNYWLGVAIVGMYAFSLSVTNATRQVMSEPLFTTWCLLTLVLVQARADGEYRLLPSIALAVTLTLAVFTRTIGILLLVASFAYLFVRVGRKFWREACLLLGEMAILLLLVINTTPVGASDLLPVGYVRDNHALLLVSPLGATVSPQSGNSSAAVVPAFAGSSPSGDSQPDLLDTWWRTVRFYLFVGVRRVAIGFGGGDGEMALASKAGVPQLPAIISLATVSLVLLGLLRRSMITRGPVSTWFTLLFAGGLLLWTGKDERLLYPIGPQIMWGLVSGLNMVAVGSMTRLFPAGRGGLLAKVAIGVVIVMLLAGSLYKSSQADDSRWHTGDLSARTTWLRSQGTPDDVVMTEAPEADFLYSGHKTVLYPYMGDNPVTLVEYVRTWDIKYVLVAPAIEWRPIYSPTYSQAALQLLGELQILANQGQARLAYSDNDGIQVFDVRALG
jgi:dolichyl-phosphate-mannose-protein mannosyltransferase